MKSLFLALALVLGVSSQAKADRWLCNMTYKADVVAKQLIVGRYTIDGKGRLYCESSTGEKRVLPLKIAGKGSPVAARIAFAKYTVYGASANLNLTVDQPEDLLGKYRMLQVQAAVGGGVGAFVAVHGKTGATLQLSGNAVEGAGINLGYSVFYITQDER